MKYRAFLAFAAFTCFLGIATPVAAEPVGVSGTWSAHATRSSCYNKAHPSRVEGSLPGRGKPYLAVADHPEEGLDDAVTAVSGFANTDGASASISIDGKAPVPMLPFGDAAFIDGRLEAGVVKDLVKANVITVTWITPSGRKIVDRYDGAGFQETRKIVKSKCPISRQAD